VYLPEWPIFDGQNVRRVERHAADTDEQITDGKWRDEIVGRLTDGTFQKEGQQDDQIPADGDETCAAGNETKHHGLPGRVRGR